MMKKTIIDMFLVIGILLLATDLFAASVRWQLTAHPADFKKLGGEMSAMVNKGYAPVGISLVDNHVYILYLDDPERPISAWKLNAYQSKEEWKAGLSRMMNQGYTPAGITSAKGTVLILYVKTKTAVNAWKTVASTITPQDVKKSITGYFEKDYVPVGITIADDDFVTLMARAPGAPARKWTIEAYPLDGKAIKDGIEKKLHKGDLPRGFLMRGNMVNVLFVDFEKAGTSPVQVAAAQKRPKERPDSKAGPDDNPMRPAALLAAAVEFKEIGAGDPGLACSLFMTPKAEDQFAPAREFVGEGLRYFFSASVMEMVYPGPRDALVLFYHPWCDVLLITAWGEEDDRCMIWDAALLTGDFIRQAGVLPYDIIPRWLRDKDALPPLAALSATDETMKAFRKTFAGSVPGQWRLELENAKTPEILGANNIGVTRMLLDGLNTFRAFASGKDTAWLRRQTADTIKQLQAGRLNEVMAVARKTPVITKKLLERTMAGKWDKSDVLAVADGKDSAFVFLSMPGWPTYFVTFFFEKNDGAATLTRIDVFNHQPLPVKAAEAGP